MVLVVDFKGRIFEAREPRINKARALTSDEVLKIAELQAKKYWYQRVGTHL